MENLPATKPHETGIIATLLNALLRIETCIEPLTIRPSLVFGHFGEDVHYSVLCLDLTLGWEPLLSDCDWRSTKRLVA